MFDSQVAEVYDFIYRGRGKDFGAEAAELAALVRSRRPAARSLLDVACGTGEHLVHLRHEFDEVAGVELAHGMRRLAERKLPGVRIEAADMREFALGRRFDAVSCLFSSVAYMPTVADLHRAVGRMTDHLVPGGVLVIEPWFFPDRFLNGHVTGFVTSADGRTVARVSCSVADGPATRMESHYLVADRDGIRHFSQVEIITLFPVEDYLAAMERAGCVAELVVDCRSDRGLFVGVRK